MYLYFVTHENKNIFNFEIKRVANTICIYGVIIYYHLLPPFYKDTIIDKMNFIRKQKGQIRLLNFIYK